MTTSQIKSRQRVKDHAEVFTDIREVNAMLDFVSDAFPDENSPRRVTERFLEPACGNGNFLVEILRRKLEHIDASLFEAMPDVEARRIAWEHLTVAALASVYGVDIQEDNILEARKRMDAVLLEHFHANAPMARCTNAFAPAVLAVLDTNIVHADWLHDRIDWVFYEADFDAECWHMPGFFRRTLVRHEPVRRDGKPVTGRERDDDLTVGQTAVGADVWPVFYIDLASPVDEFADSKRLAAEVAA